VKAAVTASSEILREQAGYNAAVTARGRCEIFGRYLRADFAFLGLA
jgi:hypothetical protein